MKNPYGVKNGKLVSVDEVESGKACGCICPACHEPLEAHKGNKKAHYFKHCNGTECEYGLETTAHLFAKTVIEQEKTLLLPGLKATPNWDELEYLNTQYIEAKPYPHEVMFKELVRPWYRLKIDDVYVEKKMGSIIPDVIGVAKGRELFIEIKVTHGVTDKKLKYIKENRFAVVEFDFSKMSQSIDMEHIKNVLTKSYKGAVKGKGRSCWINHPNLDSAQAEVTERMKKLYPRKSKATT